jgi:hypothetical protein
MAVLCRHVAEGGAQRLAAARELESRASLVAPACAMMAASMSDRDLADVIARLQSAVPMIDEDGKYANGSHQSTVPVALRNVVARAVAALQRPICEAERARRLVTRRVGLAPGVPLPTRDEVLAAVMVAQMTVAPEEWERFRVAVGQQLSAAPSGGDAIAALLAALSDLPIPLADVPEPLRPWVQALLALDIAAGDSQRASSTHHLGHALRATPPGGVDPPRLYVSHAPSPSPATRAEALRARRLLYALDRESTSDPHGVVLLDVSPSVVADWFSQSAAAGRAWAQAHHPVSDWGRYLTWALLEESGRMAPHPQVVVEADVRADATAAGGFPLPVVFPFNPEFYKEQARDIWQRGLPPVAGRQLGLVVFSAGGDSRADWEAPPSVQGVRCAIVVRPDQVLHLHHKEYPEDERVFFRLAQEASALAAREEEYPAVLRRLLLQQGVQVLARYDHLDLSVRDGQEIVVLDPSPERLRVIRESVPAFLQQRESDDV